MTLQKTAILHRHKELRERVFHNMGPIIQPSIVINGNSKSLR